MVDVTDLTFKDEVLESDLPVMLDLWAGWCEPCKRLEPIVEQVARAYAGRVKVCRLDVASNPRTVAWYHVMTLPTLLFILDGKVIGQHAGTIRPEELAEKIDEHLQLIAR